MLLIKKIPFLILLITGINCAAQFAGSRTFKLLDDNRPFKINTLFKSSNGYLYAGTTNGLYSFDGKSFKKINSNTPAVKDTVTAVFEDHTGQIWAGCKSGRLAKKNKSLLQYFEPEEGTPKVAITAFLEDKQHNIWFATNGEGIYYFYNSHLYLINEDEGLSDKYVHALALADNGDVLAATDQGINICSINGAKKKIEVLGPKNGLPDYYITAIQPSGNNNFIIGLQEKGFCLYNHSTKQITIPAAAANWNYGQVNALLSTQNNTWIATEANGLMQLPNAASAAAADFITSTNKSNISNLLQDNEGNIWMTSASELISTAGDKLNLLPIYDKAVYETIHTILSDYQNNIWAGTDGGIIKYTRSTNQWTSRVYPIKGLTSFTDITGLYQDMYHNIWLSTMGEGFLL